ncbi:hypothetical protein C8R43DRAFT_1106086 [Mycena crocata]|nr:hypothetical protein C8R43DRAFT_1106086 [Mycena crocata]
MWTSHLGRRVAFIPIGAVPSGRVESRAQGAASHNYPQAFSAKLSRDSGAPHSCESNCLSRLSVGGRCDGRSADVDRTSPYRISMVLNMGIWHQIDTDLQHSTSLQLTMVSILLFKARLPRAAPAWSSASNRPANVQIFEYSTHCAPSIGDISRSVFSREPSREPRAEETPFLLPIPDQYLKDMSFRSAGALPVTPPLCVPEPPGAMQSASRN